MKIEEKKCMYQKNELWVYTKTGLKDVRFVQWLPLEQLRPKTFDNHQIQASQFCVIGRTKWRASVIKAKKLKGK